MYCRGPNRCPVAMCLSPWKSSLYYLCFAKHVDLAPLSLSMCWAQVSVGRTPVTILPASRAVFPVRVVCRDIIIKERNESNSINYYLEFEIRFGILSKSEILHIIYSGFC